MIKLNGEEFIQTVLINDIQKMIDANVDYLAFVIISHGIELLGSFLDDKPFDCYERGLPENRFKKGLELMGSEYTNISNILWIELRCGLSHQLKPKQKINLIGDRDEEKFIAHLYKGNKTKIIYIFLIPLFQDFKNACLKVIKKLNDDNDMEINRHKK